MRITRVQAIQAHPVPASVQAPRGPFPPELFREPEVVYDTSSGGDDEGGTNFEPGATAQNNYKPPKYYRCKYCNARVADFEIPTHECGE